MNVPLFIRLYAYEDVKLLSAVLPLIQEDLTVEWIHMDKKGHVVGIYLKNERPSEEIKRILNKKYETKD